MAEVIFPTETPDITPSGSDRVLLSQTSNGGAASDATLDSLPVSTATQTAIGLKVDKTTTVNGKALSSNVTLTTDDVAEGATNLYDQVVAILASTGIQVTGTYPNFTITNSSPDQVVALTQGTGITVSGTYPNFTITNSAPDQTVTLTQGTNITITGTYPNFTINSTGGGGGGSGDMLAATYDPAGIAQQLVGTTASQELTNKTYTDVILKGTSPKNNTTVSITSGGATTVLTSASNSQIANGGTGANTAQLPVASTMQLGQYFIFRNDGSNTNALTINSSGGNLVYSLPAGENIRVVLIKNTGTDASSWRVEQQFVPTYRTITINGVTYDLSADRSWTVSGGKSDIIDFSQSGTVVTGTIATVIPTSAGTLNIFTISLASLPVGANFLVDLKKNGTSVLSAAQPITTTESATNGFYTVSTGDPTKSTISTTAFSAKDVFTVVITQVGSTFAGANFSCKLTATYS